MSSDVLDIASLVARGYTCSGRVPGGRFSHVLFWPWATIAAGVGALGLLGGTLALVYRLLQFYLFATWVGLTQ